MQLTEQLREHSFNSRCSPAGRKESLSSAQVTHLQDAVAWRLQAVRSHLDGRQLRGSLWTKAAQLREHLAQSSQCERVKTVLSAIAQELARRACDLDGMIAVEDGSCLYPGVPQTAPSLPQTVAAVVREYVELQVRDSTLRFSASRWSRLAAVQFRAAASLLLEECRVEAGNLDGGYPCSLARLSAAHYEAAAAAEETRKADVARLYQRAAVYIAQGRPKPVSVDKARTAAEVSDYLVRAAQALEAGNTEGHAQLLQATDLAVELAGLRHPRHSDEEGSW